MYHYFLETAYDFASNDRDRILVLVSIYQSQNTEKIISSYVSQEMYQNIYLAGFFISCNSVAQPTFSSSVALRPHLTMGLPFRYSLSGRRKDMFPVAKKLIRFYYAYSQVFIRLFQLAIGVKNAETLSSL